MKKKLFGRLKSEDNMEKIYDYTARRRDIDANHHVNNVNYLELAYDAFPENLNIDFSNIEIYYKKQIKLGETVSIYGLKEKDAYIICIKSQNGDNLHAVLKFY